jgi:hypothetical protein
MRDPDKLNKLLTTHRGPGEIQDWIFSLTPIGVAFVFYVVFIMSSGIEQKELFIAYGAAAGFIGLESYWMVRGWHSHHGCHWYSYYNICTWNVYVHYVMGHHIYPEQARKPNWVD